MHALNKVNGRRRRRHCKAGGRRHSDDHSLSPDGRTGAYTSGIGVHQWSTQGGGSACGSCSLSGKWPKHQQTVSANAVVSYVILTTINNLWYLNAFMSMLNRYSSGTAYRALQGSQMHLKGRGETEEWMEKGEKEGKQQKSDRKRGKEKTKTVPRVCRNSSITAMGFTSHSTQNRSFRRRSCQPISRI